MYIYTIPKEGKDAWVTAPKREFEHPGQSLMDLEREEDRGSSATGHSRGLASGQKNRKCFLSCENETPGIEGERSYKATRRTIKDCRASGSRAKYQKGGESIGKKGMPIYLDYEARE